MRGGTPGSPGAARRMRLEPDDRQRAIEHVYGDIGRRDDLDRHVDAPISAARDRKRASGSARQ